MKRFLKALFFDQSAEVDEKRVLGIPAFCSGIALALVGGIYAIFWNHPALVGPILAVSGFLTGAGITALGIAVMGDQGKLGH